MTVSAKTARKLIAASALAAAWVFHVASLRASTYCEPDNTEQYMICYSAEPVNACQTYQMSGYCDFVCQSENFGGSTGFQCSDAEDHDIVSCICQGNLN